MSTTPSTSPPRTPNDNPIQTSTSTPGSDDSSIDDLSFDYIFDSDGNYVRMSKGSSKPKSTQSSPPTPQESSLPDSHPEFKDPPTNSPLHRASLSRSESASAVLAPTVADAKPLRPFQRVASGPTLSTTTPSYLAPTIASQRSRVVPRRITTEDARERQEARARQASDFVARESYPHQDEKENIMAEAEERPGSAIGKRSPPPLTSRAASSRVSSTSRISYSTSVGSSRPLADVHVQQQRSSVVQRQPPTGFNRPGRIMKSSSSLKYSASNLGEVVEGGESDHHVEPQHNFPAADTHPEEDFEEPLIPSYSNPASHAPRHRKDLNINVQAASLSQSNSNRPRRSASLSDALNHHDDYQLQVAPPPQHGHSRPGTSLGLNADTGPRRVNPEERERQEWEARAEYKKIRKESEEQDRQSPSPTHGHVQRVVAGHHRRRDSDTLRNVVPPPSATTIGSPTVMDIPNGRPSPTASRFGHGRVSPPVSTRGRISPQINKGRVSPPTAKGRLSPPNSRLAAVRDVAKHRRSPTAPSPPTTSNQIAGQNNAPSSKTWANGERDDDFDLASSGEKDRERERERQMERERERRERREQQPVKSQQLQPYSQVASVSQPLPSVQVTASQQQQQQLQQDRNLLNRHIVVNKKAYARLDMIGKGGSSRVYRVLSHTNELYAIKRVSLDKTDAETMSGYMNEIALLKRLEGNSRIIRLIDSEVKPGQGGSKGHLMLVMECGEVDFAKLLQEQMKEPVNMVWVSYYWQQMLQAVHVIHEEKIVHSDLKPANFVLVKGQLKLIDFGIANAIANDTTNIQRDHQIGTVNYMSPEAIELPDGMRRLKVGRPSDVWSLGIILYQMVYGQPPFQHLSVYHKMKAIPDLSHVIEFPEFSVPCVPAKNNGVGPPEPPKRLEHLKQRIRPDVIRGMKSCLCRNPKERATIPELLDQEWLGSGPREKEQKPTRRNLHQLLTETETVIDPYYMKQLLSYGMKLGDARGGEMDDEALLKEAERLVLELKGVHRQATEGP